MKKVTIPSPGVRAPAQVANTGDASIRVASVRAKLSRALEAARAWRWGAVVGRAVLGALGLVVLGAIGQSAFARNVLSPAPPAPPDAGLPSSIPTVVAPMSIAAAPLASVPPSPIVPPAGATLSASLPDPAHAHATPDDPVYLNTATMADLHRLPGIGPKRAEAILALRARLGHFRQIEDLLKVKGVGRSSLRKLRPLVRLDPPPAAVVDAGAPDAHAPG
jgi:competence protein ComEA